MGKEGTTMILIWWHPGLGFMLQSWSYCEIAWIHKNSSFPRTGSQTNLGFSRNYQSRLHQNLGKKVVNTYYYYKFYSATKSGETVYIYTYIVMMSKLCWTKSMLINCRTTRVHGLMLRHCHFVTQLSTLNSVYEPLTNPWLVCVTIGVWSFYSNHGGKN